MVYIYEQLHVIQYEIILINYNSINTMLLINKK